MAYTSGDVKLANAALALLGDSAIVSFDDPPDLAGKVAQVYAPCVNALLAGHPWRFTMRKAQLSRLTAAPLTEWTYQFQLPADCETLRAIRASAGVNAPTLKEYERFEDKILANVATLFADYQVHVAPEYWPAEFYRLAQHALAADLAVIVTGSVTLAQHHGLLAYGSPQQGGNGGLTAMARRTDSQQQPPQRFTEFPLVMARQGGAG